MSCKYEVQSRMSLGILKPLITLSVILLLSFPSQSAVFSVDLGSEWVKVAVVNLKPGQSPISVAINEMSKRKSPALVAFHSGDRLLAEEAAGLEARYPQQVYTQIRDMIGKPNDFAKNFLDSRYLPYQIEADSRGCVTFKVDDDIEKKYSPEELVAMILSYAANLAEFHSKVSIKDAVVTVPPYFGQAERKGLLQAAQLAGINVLSLINEYSGAALQYGIDKDFSNGSRHVIFYDMGSSSTYAALVYFSAYNTKEYGKTVWANQFQVKDVSWNPELGGRTMESRLVEYFADEFNKKVGNSVDVRKSPKAMAKLKKQVKRTKEILSANTDAPISVESLYDDLDFRSTITREKFEELCENLWEKSLLPVKEILERSGLAADAIYAIELIGGATRVPKLQAKLQEFLGMKELYRHLDADEAIVLGASLHAANLSDGIKLNRKLGMIDGSLYGFVVMMHGIDLTYETSRQLLVPRMKKVPSKMFRSVVHNKDFEVSLAYESEDFLPPGVSSSIVAHYKISGLSDASEKYSARNLSAPIKANLHFSLSRSGILSLDRADAVIEIMEWVEVPRKNLTVDNSTSISPNISAEAGASNSSEVNQESLQIDGEIDKTSNSTVEQLDLADLGTERKLKKRTFRVPLKTVEKTAVPCTPLTQEFLAEAKIKLEALDKKDFERRRTAELKNNLEGYIYSTKEKLDTSEELEKVSTSEECQSFNEKLDEVQEWLYTDGEDASAKEFQERLDMLKAIGDPIFFRLGELKERPAAVELSNKYLNELQQIVQRWKTNKPWIPQERMDEVLNDAEKLKSWLDEKNTEQKSASGFSKPVFTSDEVYTKVFALQEKVTRVDKMPKPKPETPKKIESDRSEKENNSKTKSDSIEETDSATNSKMPDYTFSQSEEPAAGDLKDQKAESKSQVHDEL